MISKIKGLLKELEKKNKVKILFAVESGSREWGFASEDSDYDVRAVHFSKPGAYLGLFQPKDQIEVKKKHNSTEIDIVSWDIRKFANLLLKSNPTVSEWLQSEMIYINSPYRAKFKRVFSKGFSPFALKKHYVSLARKNYEKYIRGKQKANLKKYVYVLRGLACVEYLIKKNKMPPLNYKKVIGYLPKKIGKFMEEVVVKKRKSEKLSGKVNKKVNAFIESYFNKEFKKTESKFDVQKINNLVIEIIKKWR